jgi:hypothetical protein
MKRYASVYRNGGDAPAGAQDDSVGSGWGAALDPAPELLGHHEVQPDDRNFERFDGPGGYRECSVDWRHVYAPDFPGEECPTGDGGTLELKTV